MDTDFEIDRYFGLCSICCHFQELRSVLAGILLLSTSFAYSRNLWEI